MSKVKGNNLINLSKVPNWITDCENCAVKDSVCPVSNELCVGLGDVEPTCPVCGQHTVVGCTGGTCIKPHKDILWLCSNCLHEW